MSNAIEVVKVDGGTVSFDWASGEMTAQWDNGYTETWSRKGYKIEEKADAFLRFTDQWHRIAA